MNRIWITWEQQRRNRGLSEALEATLYELTSHRKGIARYLELTLRTVRLLMTTKARVVFVQNPSLVLTFLAVSLRVLKPWRLVSDAHNAGVFPLAHMPRLGEFVARIIARGCDLTIVTNSSLAQVIERRGGRACVLPDPVPDMGAPSSGIDALTGRRVVLFICSWAEDEPVGEVIRAAALLGPGVEIRITGRPKGREEAFRPLPPNVTLTGFLSEPDFVQELKQAHVIMDLTTREDCLVCGAYEAVAVERPLVVSDTAALRGHFRRGTVYTDNTADGIARSVQDALDQNSALTREMQDFHRVMVAEWEDNRRAIESVLTALD